MIVVSLENIVKGHKKPEVWRIPFVVLFSLCFLVFMSYVLILFTWFLPFWIGDLLSLFFPVFLYKWNMTLKRFIDSSTCLLDRFLFYAWMCSYSILSTWKSTCKELRWRLTMGHVESSWGKILNSNLQFAFCMKGLWYRRLLHLGT